MLKRVCLLMHMIVATDSASIDVMLGLIFRCSGPEFKEPNRVTIMGTEDYDSGG